MLNYITNHSKKNDGSIIVEAAIVLPLFMCVILTITFFIRIYQTHETIQFVLDETAEYYAEIQYVKSFVLPFELPLEEGNPLEVAMEAIGNKLADAAIEQRIRYSIITNIAGEGPDADAAFKRLFIVGGSAGLDISVSNDYDDGVHFTDIIVSYRIKIPLPIQFLGEVPIIQRAKVRAWREGGAFKAPDMNSQN